MTRVKKTRSLKRIHNVKTGNKSKLKKQAPDRQNGKRVKNRTKSVFEKFLDDNPQAKDQLNQEQLQQQAVKSEQKEVSAKDTPEPRVREEKERSLLEQLESKDFKDIY
ncbi:hypothetical protein [Oceanobacter kriegii]|uniref:hypothetical protein n=1 Tax=Oceanobacter kriegii TaxID=64972 RepID=UPI00041F237C|nr:hypothetical protein [Oceanobacter kriegii]